MRIIGVIPARYDSSRFPGKPLADICGKPMIWWVYHQCSKVKELDEVYVATDDKRIEKVCLEAEIPVIMTSKSHKTGTDRVGEVSGIVEGDIFINVQGDEPLIDPEEIRELILAFNDRDVYFASLRAEISDIEEINAKNVVKVVVDKNENALFFSRSVIPSDTGRVTYTRIYKHVGIYGYTKEFLRLFIRLPQTNLEICEGIEPLRALENGYDIRVKETTFRSIGVDYPEHIALIEKAIKMQKKEVPSSADIGDIQHIQNEQSGGGYLTYSLCIMHKCMAFHSFAKGGEAA